MGRAVRPARHVVAVALGIGLVLVGLSGCAGTTAPTASSTKASTASPAATLAPTAGAVAACQGIQLTLGVQGEQSGAGNRAYIYQLDNNGPNTCTVEGYPGLQLLNTDLQPVSISVSQQTSAYSYNNAQPQLVTLAVAADAYFVVDWVGGEYNLGKCLSAAWVRVTLPGDPHPLALDFPSPMAVCVGGVAVSPIEPTLTALGY